MKKLKWHNEKKKVDDLIPYDKNPRKMSEEQRNELQISLEKFDLVEIPAIDLNNIIIAGHQRLNILQSLGRGEEIIDVRVPNRKLTEGEFKEYNLRSNKNVGGWDLDLLANFSEETLKNIGWDSEELDNIFQLSDINEKEFDENIETKNKCPKCGYSW